MNATTIPTTSTAILAGRHWRQHAACASASVDPEIFYPLDVDPTGRP